MILRIGSWSSITIKHSSEGSFDTLGTSLGVGYDMRPVYYNTATRLVNSEILDSQLA